MSKFKNLLNHISYIPKRFLVLAGILALIVPIVASAGWAPNRPIKDWNKPADRTGFDHVTFNSFINTPNYGDERAFYDAKDATNTSSGGFKDEVNVHDGQELILRSYVHNGANQSLNESGKGIAKNTRIRVLLPSGTERALRSLSYISADNAKPGTVSDTVDFVNEQPFRLEYVSGSARAFTNAVPSGYQVADSIVNGGAKIGYNGPDGRIPGCFEFDMIVTIKVKVNVSDFEVNKQVRKVGDTTWHESITVNPGDKVEYVIGVKNISDTTLKNVVVGDRLPKHITYIPGSSILRNGNFPNGVAIGNDKVVSGGVDIGSYLPDAAGYVRFQAKVAEKAKLPCGKTTATNVGIVLPEDMPHKEDKADVLVKKICQPPEVPKKPPTQELPNTGPVEVAAAGLFGSGGLGYAIRAYRRSRKDLLSALLEQ